MAQPSQTLTLSSTLPLPSSTRSIPRLGFGVYLSPPHLCEQSCATALASGYRHIDTAQYYGNEDAVGRAVAGSKIPRAEIFLTTKILTPGKDEEETYKSVVESVAKLDAGGRASDHAGGTGKGEERKGYVDLFLIHSPNGGKEARRTMWLALERAKGEGLVRDIGVSNYGIGHIEEIRSFGGRTWPPAVDQVELHPFTQQRTLLAYLSKHAILAQAYCPLVRNQRSSDPVLQKLCATHGVTPAQILIRYCLQKGWVPLPKSDTKERIEANADVYGFDLSAEEMGMVDGLDEGEKGAVVQVAVNSEI